MTTRFNLRHRADSGRLTFTDPATDRAVDVLADLTAHGLTDATLTAAIDDLFGLFIDDCGLGEQIAAEVTARAAETVD
jgi:hypothetical protein